MRTLVIPISAAKASAIRYLSCLRLEEILVLQGSPLLGAAFAIRQPTAENLGPLAILTVANVCLVAHIFMLNDWAGLTTDLADPNKAAGVFTARDVGRKEIGGLTALLLALSLLLFSRLGPSTLCLALAIAALSALYSLPRFNWKGRPLLSSAAHLAGGVLHFLLGYSLGSAIDRRGLATATFFALIFAAGHLTQEIGDHQGDVLNAIRTNAVAFGQRRTFAASLALFTLAHVLLLLLALQGTLPRPLAALVVLYPIHLYWSLKALAEGLTYASIRRLQARYRALYAIVGLAMVAAFCGAPGHPQRARGEDLRPTMESGTISALSTTVLAVDSLFDVLDEHGYARVEPVLAAAEVEALRASLDEIPPGERRGGLRDVLARVPAVLRCACDPRILGLAESMLGAGARPVKGIVFDKTVAANWKVPWHQDLTICVQQRIDVEGFGPWSLKEGILHVQPPVEVLEKTLALRIHLDDAGPDNGALRVLPGTHRFGRLDEAGIERLRAEMSEVACGVRAGGVMLMRPLLLHASSPCRRPVHRRVLHIEYSATPLPGGLAWRE